MGAHSATPSSSPAGGDRHGSYSTGGQERCVSSRTSRAGFSLLEAVIALAIVGLTSIAALSVASTELRATEHARRALEAEALAADRLAAIRILTDEELRQMPD